MNNREIEELELKYLNKYYYFLKFAEDEMFQGFRTKEEIKNDWIGLYGSNTGEGISDFAVGAERIVYSLLNGKGIGQPNSSPVGSDMFFEVEDAFIHIDLKTVNLKNIGDFTNSIFIGENQNSYKADIIKKNGTYREKVCLTYFITIIYNKDDLTNKVISIDSMPNGQLESHYKSRPLSAGKNHGKARFHIGEVNKFELLPGEPSRIKVVYFDQNMDEEIKKKLHRFEKFYNTNY